MNNVVDMVDNAIATLTLTNMTFAQLIARIGVRVINKEENAIAWTDGKSIYINEYEINNLNEKKTLKYKGKLINCTLNKDNIVFIICHELMHLITSTIARGEAKGLKTAKELDLWNIATDYEINYLLHNNCDENGIRQPLGKKPDIVLYEEKYKDKTAEEIYDELKKDTSSSSKDDDDLIRDITNLASDLLKDHVLDKHIPIDEMTKNEIVATLNEILQSCKSNGLGSSAFERAVKESLVPVKFNWRKALAKYIKDKIKNNYTWNKPSRTGISTGIRLPSADTTSKLHIGVAVDTSGSISQKELQAMMNHVFTILQAFKHFEIDVWCCGSQVYEETLKTYTNKNKRDIVNFEIKSDGGNDMRENFPFIEKYYKGKNKIDMLIILSDFIDPLSGDTTTTSIVPCVFLVINNEKFVKPTNIQGEVYPFEV